MTPPVRGAVVDLRQYTLRPGRRDELIDLFDQYFVDGQEDVGVHVLGQFRDLDDPDRFVWLRGFDSMPARAAALQGFYYGPVWQAHRETANDTMLDSDDALLLHPVLVGPAYPMFGGRSSDDAGSSVVAVTVLYRERVVDDACLSLVVEDAVPVWEAAGAQLVGVFATEEAENNFPVLPLRTEHVVVWISRFDDDAAYAGHLARLATCPAWTDRLLPELMRGAKAPLQKLRLRPTARSHLR